MEITIHYSSSLSHQIQWANALFKGFKSHGESVRVVKGYEPTECDLAVFWGHSRVKDRIIQAVRHYLVMERWYYGPDFQQISLGFDGLNGRANFLNQDSPPDRREKWGPELKPWSPEGDYYLVVGQVQADNSCNHVNMRAWYDAKIEDLRQRYDLPVVFRPHPKALAQTVKGAHVSNNTLEVDLAGAKGVGTFSSTVGVDALIAGKPVLAYDPISMVYDIAGHHVDFFEWEPQRLGRQQWANNLAYCQWSEEEIEAGEAWEHLRRIYAELKIS